jgi:hypothetical protein
MEKLCQQFEEKLCKLLSFLTHLPSELETIADEIDNENLKNALTAVAIESDQYAKELSAHLHTLEIRPPRIQPASLQEAIIEDNPCDTHVKGEEVMHICEKSEAFFTKLYTDVLNEYFPNASLKDMMNYQLLGIRSAFMRIRLLNSLRFNN